MDMKKYLEDNIEDLIEGKKLRKYGLVFWANTAHMTINALSEEAYDSGVIDGYKVAEINVTYNYSVQITDDILK